ncbi:ABC transporter substrate-binding protein [Paenibacillus senegalimassiliensis]|uniref:ABC transporter substrate-binding protein n=1 Tax=Paenibacillus senegalimassiliensis TaxID=1737426 RepID=UPI00073F4BAC|nr:ABC transporter substrate-binding protein [Paenibacillus senegalimassiliensis]
MFRQKITSGVLVTFILALILTACGTSGSNNAPATNAGQGSAANSSQGNTGETDKEIVISFYSYILGNSKGGQGAQKLIDEFEAAHPNIRIEGVPVPVADLLGRVQADVATGTPPDVAQLGFGWMDLIANGFGAVPLESLVTQEEWNANFEGFSPKGMELGKYDGHTYGLPFTFSTPVLFYNADLFRQAGLSPDQPPVTWDEVKEAALQINKVTGAEGVHFSGLTPTTGDWIVQSLIGSNSGKIISEDRKTLQFDSPEAIEAISMWRGLVDSGAHDKLNDNEAMEGMIQGKLGMFVMTSAIQGSLLKGAEGTGWELRSAEMPAFAGKPTTPMNSGSALFILSQDPEKQQAAWEFLKFVTSKRGYSIITSEIGYLPLRPEILNEEEYLKDWAAEHPLIEPNIRQLDRLTPAEAFPGANFSQIATILMNAVQTSVLSNADVAETLHAAQAEAQKLMP